MAINREISQFGNYLTIDESGNKNVGIATTVRISGGGGLFVGGVEVIDPTGLWKGSSSGLIGAQGAQGTAGAQGSAGAQGATGNQGATGAQGSTGPTGAQGATGAQGSAGSTGAQGSTGPSGPTGAQGAIGATTYALPDTGGSSSYIFLGTWSTAQSGQTLYMTIVAHQGFNALTDQNQVTKLYFKTSNGGSNNGGFYGDGLAWRQTPLGPNIYSPSLIRIVQVSTTSYTIYGSFANYTNGSTYQVQITPGTTWTNSSTLVSAPTGTYIDITPSTGEPVQAWVNFNGTGATGTNQTIRASSGVNNVNKNGTGDYTINFNPSLSDANYVMTQSVRTGTDGAYPATAKEITATARSSSLIRIYTQGDGGSFSTFDSPAVNLAIFR